MMKFLRTSLFFVFALLFMLWVLGAAWFSSYILSMHPDNFDKNTSAIVVLTGGSNLRIKTGLELFSAQRAPVLYITGVHPSVKDSHIRSIWKGQTPLPSCCIELGYRAETTKGNAKETATWIKEEHKDVRSIRLVTSNYHMPRALMIMRATLPNVEIIPHPIRQANFPPSSEYFWKLIFSEYHKAIVQGAGLWIRNLIF